MSDTLTLKRIRIEPYSERHARAVLALGLAMRDESEAHRDMPYDEAKVLAQFRASLTSPDYCAFVALRGEEPIGLFLGMALSIYFSSTRVARDMAFYVRKDARGGRAALLLIRAFEAWAKGTGAQVMFLAQATGVAMQRTAKFYEHLGYRVVGVTSIKKCA